MNTTRRTVVRSAAWLAPAITVTATAPALAASTTPPSDIGPCSDGCKIPGQSEGGSKSTWAYRVVSMGCAPSKTITAATIGGKVAHQRFAEGDVDGWWHIDNDPQDGDSAAWVHVTVTYSDGSTGSGDVQFKPCKHAVGSHPGARG